MICHKKAQYDPIDSSTFVYIISSMFGKRLQFLNIWYITVICCVLLCLKFIYIRFKSLFQEITFMFYIFRKNILIGNEKVINEIILSYYFYTNLLNQIVFSFFFFFFSYILFIIKH
jgi:hypothetical protein